MQYEEEDGQAMRSYIVVVQASEEANIVDHGDAGGEELDCPCQQVVPGIAPQGRVVGAVVLVGPSRVGLGLWVVEVLEVGAAA